MTPNGDITSTAMHDERACRSPADARPPGTSIGRLADEPPALASSRRSEYVVCGVIPAPGMRERW
jgi:hypothetical protein